MSGARAEVLAAAGLVKQMAGQINVVIHALGILLCLPHILRPSEVIDYISLGAGNTGRAVSSTGKGDPTRLGIPDDRDH
jgi:hypothetical protein